MMTISQLSFKKIENYAPFNLRVKSKGLVIEWVVKMIGAI